MKATHANIEGTQGPTFGGGFRVRICNGAEVIASKHFPVPVEFRTWVKVTQGINKAFEHAKQFCHGFGVE